MEVFFEWKICKKIFRYIQYLLSSKFIDFNGENCNKKSSMNAISVEGPQKDLQKVSAYIPPMY